MNILVKNVLIVIITGGMSLLFYRPQTKFAKVMCLQVSVILSKGEGACVVALGGRAWFYLGGHAWLLRGACVVLFEGGMRGFIWGGMRGFIRGGMHGFIRGGVHGFIWGACVVLFGGACMVLFRGGMCGFIWGGMRGFFSFFGYNEIRSMSGRYASYWNAFLFLVCFPFRLSNHLDWPEFTWLIFSQRWLFSIGDPMFGDNCS